MRAFSVISVRHIFNNLSFSQSFFLKQLCVRVCTQKAKEGRWINKIENVIHCKLICCWWFSGNWEFKFSSQVMKVHLYNVYDGEIFTYSLPLFIGDVEDLHSDGVVQVWRNEQPDDVLLWPVVEGCFKLLVQLQPGDNTINIKHDNDILQLTVAYQKPEFSHFVRPVYIVCADDDGYFQGPESADCSPESAKQRICLGAQLIQSFTAEKMKEHGFGRVTFQLESEDGVRPVCHIFRTKLSLEQAYSMSGNDLWTHFGKELMTSSFTKRHKCKWYCFMSFTRYHLPSDIPLPKTHSEILKYTKGHTALGQCLWCCCWWWWWW